jgi:hypothetical protein
MCVINYNRLIKIEDMQLNIIPFNYDRNIVIASQHKNVNHIVLQLTILTNRLLKVKIAKQVLKSKNT